MEMPILRSHVLGRGQVVVATVIHYLDGPVRVVLIGGSFILYFSAKLNLFSSPDTLHQIEL
jgi:hypothetical protein